eukprot:CAMPEP_0183559150 /NCGR_PEP_ID=MMETSP0371-20130417/90852_1 /TAXON_ID=268820 /ORGANISM="Peridinium aciculiferum, Strain PAER-2" /LENGTH=306 /DNA_ID=CAMNT_0025766853 /DNA_START=67 /DNA_END=984 /DNA_ORIENTATION=-
MAADDTAPAKGAGQPAEEEVSLHPETAYSASSVIFFTRGKDDEVAKVLMAVEERKVQASYIGLSQKGKILQRMLLFPMGRREKKDKGDTVETAKREYVEETGDYGNLSKYLDFADFTRDSSSSTADAGDLRFWSGKNNMAVYFKAAGMINLFCEVPALAAEKEHRAAAGGVNLKELAKAEKAKAKAEAEAAAAAAEAAAAAAEAAAKEEAQAKGPSKKKRKKEPPQPKQQPKQNYVVGKTDHLEPTWIDAATLREAVATGERSPVIVVSGEQCRLFPTASSVLRMGEVRNWLGGTSAAKVDVAWWL